MQAEYERANGILEGLAEQRLDGILELPAEAGDATVVAHAFAGGDRWHETGRHWFRLRVET